MKAEALAKINRELRVGPRRPDGYHGIRSRFVTIDLADTIEVEPSTRWDLVCDTPELPTGESNLVARAARALASRLGRRAEALVRLSKRVPMAAGLGGGSADAGVALALLSRLWGRTLPEKELSEVAAGVGSDVPFFLTGGEADVGGRGEAVLAREDGAPHPLTLLLPPFALSTAEVYAAFDRLGASRAVPERLAIEESGCFFGPNDLERAAVAVRAEMGDYLAFARSVARECALTGSGSTIVLVGASPKSLAALRQRFPDARTFETRTVGRAEYVRRSGLADRTAPTA